MNHPSILSKLFCLLLLLVGLPLSLAAQHMHKLCLEDEAGKALLFVDIKGTDDQLLGQTGLDGCISFTHPEKKLEIHIQHLKYEAVATTLQAGATQTLALKHPPAPQAPGTYEVIAKEPKEIPTTDGTYHYRGIILTESGEPLIGATVLVKGTSRGTVTDLDGAYDITAPEAEAELVVSYTGFTNMEVPAKSGERLSIKMDDAVALDEVVVTSGRAKRERSVREMLGMSRAKGVDATPAMSAPDASAPPPPPPPPPAAEYAVEESFSIAYDAETYEERIVYADEGSPATKDIEQLPNAGQLTAGEVNDFSKWELWSDISQEDLGRHRGTWRQYADHRYSLQLTNEIGAAVVNAPVELFDGQGNLLWSARTDAQGRAELWAHYFREVDVPANSLSIRGVVAGKSFELAGVKPFHQGINFHTIAADCEDQAIVDVAFVVDATGSMGDEISYLQAELLDVMQGAQDSLAGADLRLGSVFYRDLGDEYLTRHHDLTAEFGETVKFVQTQSANGGGDGPEAVEDALEVALDQLQWREEATTRLLFLVLDAPPHQAEDNVKRMQVAVARAAAEGIQIIPVACSGVDKSTEYLMRAMALATNGTYTFLTDHSGIGNKHIEPSTDSYEVEYLNGVLLRLLVDRSRLYSCTSDTPMVSQPLIPVEHPLATDWDCYPNPTSGPLTVRTTTMATEGFLLDSNGKLLQRFTASERFQLDLSTYPAGQYWLKLGEEGESKAVVLVRY